MCSLKVQAMNIGWYGYSVKITVDSLQVKVVYALSFDAYHEGIQYVQARPGRNWQDMFLDGPVLFSKLSANSPIRIPYLVKHSNQTLRYFQFA